MRKASPSSSPGLSRAKIGIATLLELFAAKECGLKRVALDDTELFEKNDSSCCFFFTLDLETALFIGEGLAVLRKQVWEHSNKVVVLLCSALAAKVMAPVHEYVFLARVAMNIHVKCDLALGVQSLYQLLCIVNCGVQQRTRVFPTTIEVDTEQRGAVISVDHTVGVEHRNHFEDEVFAKVACLRCIREQKVEDSLHHKGRVCLARVHTTRNYDCVLLSMGFLNLHCAQSLLVHVLVYLQVKILFGFALLLHSVSFLFYVPAPWSHSCVRGADRRMCPRHLLTQCG